MREWPIITINSHRNLHCHPFPASSTSKNMIIKIHQNPANKDTVKDHPHSKKNQSLQRMVVFPTWEIRSKSRLLQGHLTAVACLQVSAILINSSCLFLKMFQCESLNVRCFQYNNIVIQNLLPFFPPHFRDILDQLNMWRLPLDPLDRAESSKRAEWHKEKPSPRPLRGLSVPGWIEAAGFWSGTLGGPNR